MTCVCASQSQSLAGAVTARRLQRSQQRQQHGAADAKANFERAVVVALDAGVPSAELEEILHRCRSSQSGMPSLVDAQPVTAVGLLTTLQQSTSRPSLPVHVHKDRVPSSRRGVSLAFLRGLREFYLACGALDKLMSDVCKEEGFDASVCALTASTGLSLAESVLIAAADADVSALVGTATVFFSYSWTGTRLVDMLMAIESKVADLEVADGLTRFVWIDMFAASQNLLAGRYLPIQGDERTALRLKDPAAYRVRKEDTDRIFESAMEEVGELLHMHMHMHM